MLDKSVLNKPIQILSPQLANQIAAGEVVERPASVIKELVENSLDAGASQIHIEIEQGGQKRMLIRDNGQGISKEQLSLALSRHATSKISNIDDLENISSMGFRGEALASISSVSRLTLTSKPVAQSEAWQACAEGQQMAVEITPAAHPDGTSIEVLDLFFNTPARRKFLRTGKTEFQHIEQIVKRIALTRQDVQFVLVHNQKVCCRYPAVKDIAKRIEQVCGKNILAQCTAVNYQFEDVNLHGWCSKLGHGAHTRDLQYTFVNGRMMKDKLLSHALRQVYEDTLAPQQFAIYVLYLSLPPQQIDVNVHPAKHEVRFHQSRQIHDLVFKAVSEAIGDNNTHEQLPNHDYIRPLEASDSTANSSVLPLPSTQPLQNEKPFSANRSPVSNTTSYSAYQPQTPSRREINASNEFYASLGADSDIPFHANLPDLSSSSECEHETENKAYAQAVMQNQCFFNPPYLIFSHQRDATNEALLKLVHIQYFITKLIKQRWLRSTVSQALLMPVSVKNQLGLLDSDLQKVRPQHFEVTLAHKKLILKQVPSELRDLPWASIFPQLSLQVAKSEDDTTNTHNATKQSQCKQSYILDSLCGQIAKYWQHTLNINTSMLNEWFEEVSEADICSLCEQHGKTLALDTWMANDG